MESPTHRESHTTYSTASTPRAALRGRSFTLAWRPRLREVEVAEVLGRVVVVAKAKGTGRAVAVVGAREVVAAETFQKSRTMLPLTLLPTAAGAATVGVAASAVAAALVVAKVPQAAAKGPQLAEKEPQLAARAPRVQSLVIRKRWVA